MSVEYIVHEPGDSGENLVYNKIAAAMKDPLAQIYVVTPKKGTFQAEEEIYRRAGVKGHLGLKIVSPGQLAREVIGGAYGAAEEELPAFQKTPIVHRIIRKHSDELPVFGQYEAHSFAAQVADAISALHRDNIHASDLAAYAKTSGSAHVRDLAFVYEKYRQALGGRRDSDDLMDLAAEHISDLRSLRDAALVVVMGFPSYTEQEMRLVEEVMRTAPDTLLSIYGSSGMLQHSSDASDGNMYRHSIAAGRRFLESAARSGLDVTELSADLVPAAPADIEYAARHLFSYETPEPYEGSVTSIRLVRAGSQEEEVRAVAEEIARLHEEEGVAFGDVAVVYGEDESYADTVRRVFEEAHIPSFSSDIIDLAQTGVGIGMLGAASLAFGPVRAEDLFDYHAGTSAPPGWASLCRTALSSVDTESDEGILDDNSIPARLRSAVEKELEPLRGKFQGTDTVTAYDLFGALSSFLRRKWNGRKESIQQSIQSDALFDALEKSWLEGLNLIDGLRRQFRTMHLHPGEARDLLESAFHAARFASVPQGTDEVQVGRLGAMEVPSVHTLFLVGLNDEVLPRFAQGGTDILTFEEKQQIRESTGRMSLPTREEEQKTALVAALRRARKKLWMSYNSGTGIEPSIVVERMQGRLFPDKLHEETVDSSSFRLQENQCADALRTMAMKAPLPPVFELPAFEHRRKMAENAQQGLQQPDCGPDAAPSPHSATMFQTYSKCPYRYYLSYGLGLKDPLDPMKHAKRGNYVHKVMELIGRKIYDPDDSAASLYDAPAKWSDVPAAQFDHIVEQAMAEAAEDEYAGRFVRESTHAEAAVCRDQLRRGIDNLMHVDTATKFVPIGFEREFEALNGSLLGRIDRVDSARFGDITYYFVTDYKTGETEYSLDDVLAGSDSVQLLFYAVALKELMAQGQLPPGQIAGAGFLRMLPKVNDISKDKFRGHAYGFASLPYEEAKALYGTYKEGRTTYLSGISKLRLAVTKHDYHSSDRQAYVLFRDDPSDTRSPSLEVVTDYIVSRIEKASIALKNGDVQILPAYSGSGDLEKIAENLKARYGDRTLDGCRYCQFGSICRFDPRQKTAAVRNVRKDTVLNDLKEFEQRKGEHDGTN